MAMTFKELLSGIWKEPRRARKKEQLRLIGTNTGIEGYEFVPTRTPVVCPICNRSKAWARRQETGEYITYCYKGCKPVSNHVIVIEPLKIRQK